MNRPRKKPRVQKVIYNKITGEIEPQCPYCGVFGFPDAQTANYHFHQILAPNHAMADIEYYEKLDLMQIKDDTLAPKDRRLKYKIDTRKIRSKLKDRDTEEHDVHEHGITYKKARPVKAIIDN